MSAAPVFTPTIIHDGGDEGQEPVQKDTVPPMAGVEYPCEVCGREAGPYGGKGRKPRFCADHKPARAKSTGTRASRSPRGTARADAAADVLWQTNNLVAVGLHVTQFPDTADELSDRNEAFRDSVRTALAGDPELCDLILKSGGMNARVSLIIAYAMLAGAVVPTFRAELSDRRAIAAERREQLAEQ